MCCGDSARLKMTGHRSVFPPSVECRLSFGKFACHRQVSLSQETLGSPANVAAPGEDGSPRYLRGRINNTRNSTRIADHETYWAALTDNLEFSMQYLNG